MKKIVYILCLLMPFLFASCSNNHSESSGMNNSTLLLEDTILKLDNRNASTNTILQTGLIYELTVKIVGYSKNIELVFDDTFLNIKNNFSFSHENSSLIDRLYVKDKVGNTTIKIYANDVLIKAYDFTICDDSIKNELIDATKNRYYSERFNEVVKITSLPDYNKYVEKIKYKGYFIFTEKYFEEYDVYFIYFRFAKNREHKGITKIYNQEDIVYFDINCETEDMTESSFDYYLYVYGVEKSESETKYEIHWSTYVC